MPTLQEIVDLVESATGHELRPDEGLKHGDGSAPVRGATVAWMPTPDAIQAAGEAGHDLLIGHESLYQPLRLEHAPEGWEQWPSNRGRRELLERYGLRFLRLHGSVDEICIFDEFAALLGLRNPVFADGLVKVFAVSPQPLRMLVEHVKRATGMPAVRVAGAEDLDAPVSRVGLPWGGLGLFVNVGYQQRLIAQGCDAFVAGESDNYGFRFAAELGIPTIETSHEVSENPGLARFTTILADAFPDASFHFHENVCVWRVM